MRRPARPRTTIRRLPERGVDDRTLLHGILDEALIAHVGYPADGHAVVIPTLHARMGDDLLLHGSPGAGFLRYARIGGDLCVTVTVLDGLVLARSAFHHSANYRSAVVFGPAHRLRGTRKREALDAFVDKLAPGRRPHLRPTTEDEVRRTEVVAVSLTEASVKARSGPPGDDEDDYGLPIWAGVVPFTPGWGAPEPDPRNLPGATVPEHVVFFRSQES